MAQILGKKIPLSLYIHIPWCVHKCPYCDFNSYTAPKKIPGKDYHKALIQDLKNDLSKIHNRKLHSIFIGGGTPSLLSPNIITKLINKITNLIPIKNNIEITLEANPGSVTKKQLQTLRIAGVNRLSIGIQSFQNDKLKTLGRIHDHKEAIRAVKMAQAAGFSNINIDLMYGIPKQTVQDAIYDIKFALSLKPTHLSWYQLTIEPHSAFYKHSIKLPNEELIWKMQQQGQQIIHRFGFKQYEISAFSKPNSQCQHNLNYWHFGDYLGIGAGSHSKITDFNLNSITRISKHKNPKIYLNKKPNFVATKKTIKNDKLVLEFMLNALRLTKAIPINLFTERTNLDLNSIINPLNEAQQNGFLKWNKKNIIVTSLGKRFLNELLRIF
ncbi:MAG: coproporphyrinogen III oxidase [Coxiella sp. DG_40]|nr:MAG: coproporphyrinogen III oxidase [Coxiella sp. DG_40]